ncbi:hypothetical protein DRE_02894 [Drechslerella stenobrocha 248]|uniref:Vacuolar protein sorting-associated protein 62 n=1 Tax=Drechslerella stenobrocha 248 TaxID=1043628 RepID=W7HVY6_9PEZI|nr:hypothetical protein DRE_02894 [Drechslerella stenobrocha 248]
MSLIRTTLLQICFSCALVQAASIARRAPAGVPQFALDYGPLIYLHSGDPYRPSDISSMLANAQPKVNFEPVAGAPNPLTLDNLNALNGLGGESVYLTATKDVATDNQQAWLKGVAPNSAGKTDGAISSAIIVNEKDSTTTDVFYFFFYNYNSAPPVLGITFGDHVGDWEHIMIRFKDGVPSAVWYSQHADGQAFTYSATRKNGKRPIGYSSKGSHANYAVDGKHDHTIPQVNLPANFLLTDDTNAGILWDPLSSAYFVKFDGPSNTFTAYDPDTPVNWLYYNGKWGDKQYPTSHKNQYVILGQPRFADGPSGPLSKDLNRQNVCPGSVKTCWVRPFLTAKKAKT